MRQILYKVWLNTIKDYQIHFICWPILFLYEIGVAGVASGVFQPISYYLAFCTLNLSVFYFHSNFLLRRFFTDSFHDIWRVPLLTILELTAYCSISVMITLVLRAAFDIEATLTFLNVKYLSMTVFRGVQFILYSTLYFLLLRYGEKKQQELKKTLENEQLKNELLRSEQDFLRAQINPHLLFNTLSFIKYAARKKPEEADEAIMCLSDIMGFALENNQDTALLVKELEQVENIIKLNQLRYNHTLNINYTAKIHDQNVTTIPIMLLTLVENVFKHGYLLNEGFPASIEVESTPEFLRFQTSNLPKEHADLRSNNTGLLNIASRLDQFYKGKYRFSYGLDKNVFKVEVKINYQNI